MRAVSKGSSEKHSKPRPLSGVRTMLTVGARSTSTPRARVSRPRAWATSWTSLSSQVAASATGQGKEEDGRDASKRVPRTPAGPSDMTIGRKPRSFSAYSLQLSAPVRRRTFCSRLSRATRRDAAGTVPAALLISNRLRSRRLELHEDVRHLRVAWRRVHVRVRLVGPARVLRAAEHVPVGSVEQRSVGNFGGHDLLELLNDRVEARGVAGVGALVLAQGSVSVGAGPPLVVGYRVRVLAVEPVLELDVRDRAVVVLVDCGLPVGRLRCDVGVPVGVALRRLRRHVHAQWLELL